jgi:hypothetical protein
MLGLMVDVIYRARKVRNADREGTVTLLPAEVAQFRERLMESAR